MDLQLLYKAIMIDNAIIVAVCSCTVLYLKCSKKSEGFDVAWGMMFQVLALLIVGNAA